MINILIYYIQGTAKDTKNSLNGLFPEGARKPSCSSSPTDASRGYWALEPHRSESEPRSHTDLSLNHTNPKPLLGALWPIAKFDLHLLGPSLHQTLSGNPAFHFVPGTILCPVTRTAHKNMLSPPWETHGPGRRLTEAVIITIISISKRGWYRGGPTHMGFRRWGKTSLRSWT